MDKPDFYAALTADEHETERARITAELAAVDMQRAELARMWARRQITQAEWAEARSGLDAEQQHHQAALAAVPRPVADIDPQAIRAAWENEVLTLDEQRSIIDMFISAVIVHPAAPGTRRFAPDRITIEWRTT